MPVTPRISLVAYADRDPDKVFVAIPNERARYVRTERCVVEVWCPACKSAIGEPCRNKTGYTAGVHYKRRDLARRYQREAASKVEERIRHLDESHFRPEDAEADEGRYCAKHSLDGPPVVYDKATRRPVPFSLVVNAHRGVVVRLHPESGEGELGAPMFVPYGCPFARP